MQGSREKTIGLIPALLLLMLIVFQTGQAAGTPALWGNLQPGDYSVGFTTLERYDLSRTYRSKLDYFGQPLDGENARAIQISLWYPVQSSEDETGLVWGEYAFPIPDNPDFFPVITAAQQRELQRIMGLFGNNQGTMLDASNIEMGAIRDAVPAEGKFPLIIYFPDLTDGISDNFVLCEYLASNGFVIMTTHQIGTSSFNPGANLTDLETIIRDKEFALANVKDLEYIDPLKIGLLGTGAGGLCALMMQMRNFDVDAVATLDGWDISGEHKNLLDGNPFIHFPRMNVPLLEVYFEAKDNDLGFIDSCKYSNRHIRALSDTTDMNLTSYPSLRSYMDTLNVDKVISRPTYEFVAGMVKDFFRNFLIYDNVKYTFSETKLANFKYLEGFELPPTPDQFNAIIQSQGGVAAVELFNKFEKNDPGGIPLQEAVINMFGYRAMQQGQNDDALALFKLNSEQFPNSANVWDSYSDGLQAVGDAASAINCYKKVLEVLPLDSLIDVGLKETLKTNADSGIVRLSQQ